MKKRKRLRRAEQASRQEDDRMNTADQEDGYKWLTGAKAGIDRTLDGRTVLR